MHKILKELTMLDGIPSIEKEVRDYMKNALKDDVAVTTDGLGSFISSHGEKGPKIMIAGHMDEVGFMVTRITDEGYIKFTPAGGWWSQVMLAQQFNITTLEGKKIRGTIGAKAPHILTPEERNKPVNMDDMFLDIGASNKEEAKSYGIKPGDMMTPFIETIALENPKYYLGKAFDNRVGCAAVIDVMKSIKDTPHENIIYGVGTVQEEVGLRGAKTSAHFVNPDIGIAVDTTISYDFPGGSKETELGKGPAIMIKDSSMLGHKPLRDFVLKCAESENIPVQLTSLSRGGTDGGQMHLAHEGVPSIALCLPVRYLHSHTSMIHEDDYLNLVKLLKVLVDKLDAKTVQEITYGS